MDGKAHKKIEESLGLNSDISNIMDMPSTFLGRQHRILYHTPREVVSLAGISFLSHQNTEKFLEDVIAGQLHIAMDKLNTDFYRVFDRQRQEQQIRQMQQKLLLSIILNFIKK